MKSVCIIGAGPGGLVAAKTFLQSGRFKVTVYEKDDKIGGIWAFPKRQGAGGYLSPQTPTNLSRFTVGFSDLSWQSLGGGETHVPMFPSAARVGQYLELYKNRYVPDSTIKLQHSVISADHVERGSGHQWKVVVQTGLGSSKQGELEADASASLKQNTEYFDYLVNAAGFFSKPNTSESLIPKSVSVKEVHSSEFRELYDLFNDQGQHHGGNILVYGGGNSSGEVAANIAFHLSSSQYGAAPSPHSDRFKDMKVYHVTPRPLYAVPPFVPSSTANTFIPLDLGFYDLKLRQLGPIVSSSGPLKPDVAASLYAGIQGLVGDQKDLGAPALVTMEKTTPYATLSESYAEFVRSGLIIPVAGRLTGYEADSAHTCTAVITTPSGTQTHHPSIAASVSATGYTPSAAISFLSSATKLALSYSPSSPRLPILLQNYQTLNPALPTIGFIGFYEGPYWGVMEMQARLLCARWSGTAIPSPPDEDLEKLAALRAAMEERAADVPQYWFSDYTGYLSEIARGLGLERHDFPFAGEEKEGPVCAARYLAPGDDREEATTTRADLKAAVEECAQGRFRARATFRALQGRWHIERSIKSSKADMPSGTLVGTAGFHPRAPSEGGVDLEYLYIEEGEFTTGGLTMQARRRYVYRYTEATDKLSVWFVKVDDNRSADYLFHDVKFEEVDEVVCAAQAKHLCGEDDYNTDYEFVFKAVALESFEVRHRVMGPRKDYTSTTIYTR